MQKIVLISHSSSLGGGTICFSDIVKMLEKNYRLTTYIPELNSPLGEILKERKCEIKQNPSSVPALPYYSGALPIFSLTFIRSIINWTNLKLWEEMLMREKPDIVIVNSSVMIPLGRIIKKVGAKAICFNRETFVEGTFMTNKMITMMDKWFDSVIFISEYDRNVANLKKAKTAVIADCIELENEIQMLHEEACEKLAVDVDKFHLLFLGGDFYIKGLDITLEALKLLKNENIELFLAGKVENRIPNNLIKRLKFKIIHPYLYRYYSEINKLLSDSELLSKIRMYGSQEDVSKLFLASDVVLFSSKVPHQSRPVFEAGYYNKPVIITDYPQTFEYAKNTYNGLTFPPNNSEALADCIKLLYYDRELCSKLGGVNYQMTAKLHDYFTERDKLLKLLNELF